MKEKSLRVAFLSEHASPLALLGGLDAGGQNVYVDEVSRNLGQLGYSVDIFTRRDDAAAPEVVPLDNGVRVVHLAAGQAHFIPKDDIWPHMPTFRDELLRFMLRDGARYDVLHGNFWMSGWAAADLQRRLGVPAVQIFHAMGKTKQRHQGAADTSPGDRIDVELGIVRDVERIIAQCPAERAELVDDYDAAPGRVVIIPSAVNIEQFTPSPRDDARRRIGVEHDGRLVVYVGRMLPRKDVRNIVRAVAQLTDPELADVRLMVVGGETHDPDLQATPELGALQRLAAELGVSDRLIFVGKRQPSELRHYYAAGDVVVTTPWYEPFGLTPLEAMACGRPVIGSAVGGITFTIKDGATGLLVPPRDPEALAGALRTILSQQGLREHMGRAARARVEREFTWRTVARRTAALYESLAQATDDRPQATDQILAGHAKAAGAARSSVVGRRSSAGE
ncbi:MAG: hypothetical protein RLZZ387_3822 [Chloroflexota bacterium]|jgi:glycosyltransferase involved in cell wall biosynthesis